MNTGDKIMRQLGMEPVPDEGGSFVRIHTGAPLPGTKSPSVTSILYLLRGAEYSRWHKLGCDELWNYHAGETALQLLLFPDGTCEERKIGPDVLEGEMPQSLVPAGIWQSTVLTRRTEDAWGLFGTVCTPGFEYELYTGGEPAELMKQYPGAAERIRTFGTTIPDNGINTEG